MTKKANQSNRRTWLKSATAASAAVAFPTIVPASALGRGGAVAPSERIVLGGLGIGPRGTTDLKCFLANSDVQFVAIADLQKSRREAVKVLVDETYGNKDCVLYQDMYDVLGREDIDALLIATGDRWHTMASVLAAKAGKDVYCEKPCSLTIAESRALADGYRKYNRVYQAGTQRRTIGNFEFAKNLVRTENLESSTRFTRTRVRREPVTIGYRPSRSRRQMSATGTVGSVPAHGDPITPITFADVGVSISIFTVEGFWSGDRNT